jgi:hypothetical protein
MKVAAGMAPRRTRTTFVSAVNVIRHPPHGGKGGQRHE